jgi:phage host-nuclease inhibitor protein Gam
MKTKKTRTKTTVRPAIYREEVDMLLNQMFGGAINEQKLLAEKNRRIAEIEAEYAPALKEIAQDRADAHALIQQWAEANPKEFEKRKSIDTPFALFGFRTGTPKLALLSRKWTWKSVLASLLLVGKYIRRVPEVDKETVLADYAAKKVTAAELAPVGLKVTQEEGFFIDLKVEQAETREATATPIEEAA